MKLEFLQVEEDICQFVDFLYDHGHFLSRQVGDYSGVPIDRNDAKDIMIADLYITCARNYYIGSAQNPQLLFLSSCGGESHPRCVKRMKRYAGIIAHCIGRQDDPLTKQLFSEIRKFLKQHYAYQNVNEDRFKAYFGPHYLRLDAAYHANPEPTSLCPGYIRLSCLPQHLSVLRKKLQDLVDGHPEIRGGEVRHYTWCDKKDTAEVYVSLLIDRTQLTFDDVIHVAEALLCQGSRMRVAREKRYETGFTVFDKYRCADPSWSVRVTVEPEWKGFGK